MNENHQENLHTTEESLIPSGVRFVRIVYAVGAIIWFYVLIRKVTGADRFMSFNDIEIIVNVIINSLAIYGLYKRKSWIVPLILIYSAWNFVAKFIRVIGGASPDLNALGHKFGHLLIALFFAYQLYLFTRKETKRYFQEKGQIVV
jgi:multisubunit Na+/H+ antiporter MnhF subunit